MAWCGSAHSIFVLITDPKVSESPPRVYGPA